LHVCRRRLLSGEAQGGDHGAAEGDCNDACDQPKAAGARRRCRLATLEPKLIQ